MPLTPEELRRFVALERLVGDLKKSLDAVTTRVEVVEAVAAGPQLARIADALNQFGGHHFSELQHQSLTNQPLRPWKPV